MCYPSWVSNLNTLTRTLLQTKRASLQLPRAAHCLHHKALGTTKVAVRRCLCWGKKFYLVKVQGLEVQLVDVRSTWSREEGEGGWEGEAETCCSSPVLCLHWELEQKENSEELFICIHIWHPAPTLHALKSPLFQKVHKLQPHYYPRSQRTAGTVSTESESNRLFKVTTYKSTFWFQASLSTRIPYKVLESRGMLYGFYAYNASGLNIFLNKRWIYKRAKLGNIV